MQKTHRIYFKEYYCGGTLLYCSKNNEKVILLMTPNISKIVAIAFVLNGTKIWMRLYLIAGVWIGGFDFGFKHDFTQIRSVLCKMIFTKGEYFVNGHGQTGKSKRIRGPVKYCATRATINSIYITNEDLSSLFVWNNFAHRYQLGKHN